MKILCKLFGHKIGSDGSYNRYFKPDSGPIDGINRIHVRLKCHCDRCDEVINFGHIHADNGGRIVIVSDPVIGLGISDEILIKKLESYPRYQKKISEECHRDYVELPATYLREAISRLKRVEIK